MYVYMYVDNDNDSHVHSFLTIPTNIVLTVSTLIIFFAIPFSSHQKKVMMKFRTMLKNEDFENLFRDPLIGDFL